MAVILTVTGVRLKVVGGIPGVAVAEISGAVLSIGTIASDAFPHRSRASTTWMPSPATAMGEPE